MSYHLLIARLCQPVGIYNRIPVPSPTIMYQAHSCRNSEEAGVGGRDLNNVRVEIRKFGLALPHLKVLSACCRGMSLTWLLTTSGDYTFSSRRGGFLPSIISASAPKRREAEMVATSSGHHCLISLCQTKGLRLQCEHLEFLFFFFSFLGSFVIN